MTKETLTELALIHWRKGDIASERLAAHILKLEGYTSIDPIHPLGGQDGLKDIICMRDGKKWIGAAHFPAEKVTISKIQKKFLADLKGVNKNNANGIAFVTNQRLTETQRKELIKSANQSNTEAEIFHLEKILGILDSPTGYGIRLQFLDIEMNKDEQTSFIATRDKEILEFRTYVGEKLDQILKGKPSLSNEIYILKQQIGDFFEGTQKHNFVTTFLSEYLPHQLTIEEFTEFGKQLEKIESLLPSTNNQLDIFLSNMRRIVGTKSFGFANLLNSMVDKPINLEDVQNQLTEYERKLDRIISKQKIVFDNVAEFEEQLVQKRKLFDAALAKVADVEPDEYDKLP